MWCRLDIFRASLRSELRQFLGGKRSRAGAIGVEFAIVATLLSLMLVPVIDVGFGIYRAMQVRKGAQAGAEYAMAKGSSGFSASSISKAILASTNFSGVSATPAPKSFCGCAGTSGVTEASCTSVCANGSTPGEYVTASAEGSYTNVFPNPLRPKTEVYKHSATVRIK
jgi:Flp pilus assembly protein TadG